MPVSDVLNYIVIKQRIRRTPKEILERQTLTMTTQYDIDCYIDDAISEGFAKGFEKVLEKGIEKGLAQGLEQGIEKGKDEARTEAIVKALRRGKLTQEEIAEDNDVSIDRVREIQRNLQGK